MELYGIKVLWKTLETLDLPSDTYIQSKRLKLLLLIRRPNNLMVLLQNI